MTRVKFYRGDTDLFLLALFLAFGLQAAFDGRAWLAIVDLLFSALNVHYFIRSRSRP